MLNSKVNNHVKKYYPETINWPEQNRQKLALNIGLNCRKYNGENTAFKTSLEFRKAFPLFLGSISVSKGRYKGSQEYTVVIVGSVPATDFDTVAGLVRGLASELDQDCIACAFDGRGHVINNDDFNEVIEFDYKYFICPQLWTTKNKGVK